MEFRDFEDKDTLTKFILQQIQDTLEGGITSRNLSSFRNTMVFNEDDSLDENYPFMMDFKVIDETIKIVSAKVSFKIKKFRAYNKLGTESGGGGEGSAIDVGMPAVDGTHYYIATNRTYISLGNPANGSGVIESVEIWAHTSMTNVQVATFYSTGGNNYSTRDTEGIANVAAGAKRTFAVNLDVVAGDFLGIYFQTGQIDLELPRPGNMHRDGDNIPCTNTTFTVNTNSTRAMSLYGSGVTTTAPHTHDIVFGIYEEGDSPTIHFYISEDESDTTWKGKHGGYTKDQDDIDITSYLTAGIGEKRLKFTTNGKCRISARIMLKLDIRARG